MKQYFKRSTAGLLCLALLMGLFAGVPGALIANAVTTDELTVEEPKNLLADYNPSFENYTIPNWTITPGVAQSKNEDGTWSLKINVQDATATSDAVAVTAGMGYIASAQIWGEGKLSVVFYGADGAVVDEQSVVKATEAWETLTLAAKAPATAAKAAVKLSATTAKAVYFDDASLKVTLPYADVDLVNGDFQTGNATGWNPNKYDGTTYEVVTDDADNSYYQVTSNESKFQFATDRYPVEEGVAYMATIKVQASVSTYFQVYIQYYAAKTGGSAISGVDNAYNTHDSATEDGKWDTVSCANRAPEGAKYARILVTNPYLTTANIKFDDAKLIASNGLLDGSFESGFNNQNVPFGLRRISDSVSKYVKVSKDEGFVSHGVASLNTTYNTAYSTSVMNIIPGETYTATIDAKTPLDANTWTNSAALYIFFYTKAETKFSVTAADHPGHYSSATVTPNNTGWTTITNTFTAPEDAVYAVVMFQTTGGKECYFDNLTFTAAPAENLLTNADFEERDVGEKVGMTDWISSGAASAVKNSEVVYEDGKGYVAHISGLESSGYWVFTQRVKVEPGKSYTATASLKGDAALNTEFIQTYIRWYTDTTSKLSEHITNDSTGKAITQPMKSADTVKFANATEAWQQSGVGPDWQTVTVTGTAPDNAQYAIVLFAIAAQYTVDKSVLPSVTTVHRALNAYIDDVKLYKDCAHTWPETPTSTTATCVNPGVETYTCSNCGATGTKDAPATGHTYDNDADPTCNVCSTTRVPAFSTATLVLKNDLAVRFYVPKALFENTGFTSPKAVFSFGGKEYTVSDYTETTDNGVAVYAFTFANIAPHQAGETITYTLKSTYDGKEVSSASGTYSVLTYCQNKLSGDDAKLKTLVSDLLNYCAAVQTSLGKTPLVTEGLPLTPTAADPALESRTNVTTGTVANPAATWDSVTLVLRDNVTIRMFFKADSIEGLSVKITGAKEATITDIKKDGEYYYVDFNGLMATDMRDVINATVCNGETAVSETLTYSVESYAAKHQNDTAESLGALVKAMMKYGDSAANYQ